MPLIVVPGVNGTSIQVQFQTANGAYLAIDVLAGVYISAWENHLGVVNNPTSSPSNPLLQVNEFTIGDEGGVQGAGPTVGTVPAGYLAIVDAELSGVAAQIVGADQANETVIASGSLSFSTAGGSGTLVSAQGNNVISAPATGGGNWDVYFDSGSNTVYAASGNFQIQTDSDATFGSNLLFLGSGSDTVYSWGQDTVVAGAVGSNLVVLNGDQSLFWGNSGQDTVVAAGGSDTIVQGSGPETIFAGAISGLFYGGAGGLTFVAGSGTAPTVIAGSGNATLYGTDGTGTFFVGSGQFLLDGTGGDQTVAGPSGSGTAVLYANSGDIIYFAGPTSGNVLEAGAGSATLNGANASGNNFYLAGPGTALLVAGAGRNTMEGGAGASTMVGASGATVFEVSHAFAGGQELITNWNAADQIDLVGYGAATGSGLPAGASLSAVLNGTLLLLPDGTHVMFANATPTAAQFVLS